MASANTLSSLIENKDIDIYSKKEMVITLLKQSSSNTGWRGLDFLLNLLKKNILENDGSLKPNNFTKIKEYIINKVIIKEITKLKDEKNEDNCHVSSNSLDLLLKILRENDNSLSNIDDFYHRGNIISSLLRSDNHNYIKILLKEVKLFFLYLP